MVLCHPAKVAGAGAVNGLTYCLNPCRIESEDIFTFCVLILKDEVGCSIASSANLKKEKPR